MTPNCRACGSARVLRRVRITSPTWLGAMEPSVSIPSPSLLARSPSSTVSARVCVDCGSVELYADDIAALQQAYEEALRGSLNLQIEADALG